MQVARVRLTLSRVADSLPNELKGARKCVGSVALSVPQSVKCDTTVFDCHCGLHRSSAHEILGVVCTRSETHVFIFGFVDTGRVLRYRIQTIAALRCLSPVGSPGIRGLSCTGHLVLLSTQQFVEPRHRGFRLTALADLWTLLVM